MQKSVILLLRVMFYCDILTNYSRLDAFAELRNAIISFVMSVCPSVRMEQRGSYWTEFDEIGNGRSQETIWCMRIACWIPKATNTYSEYVTLIAFPQQQWLHERASELRYTYTAASSIHHHMILETIIRNLTFT